MCLFLDERFYVQRRRRLRRGGYSSTYLALKKELREANLQSLLGGSSSFTSSTNIDSDPLLSSFMFNSPSVNESANKSATPATQGNSATKVSFKESLKRYCIYRPSSAKKALTLELVSHLVSGFWFAQRHSRSSTFRWRSREGEKERVCARFVLVNHAWRWFLISVKALTLLRLRHDKVRNPRLKLLEWSLMYDAKPFVS